MNFTAAMRISNCRRLLASLLRLLRSLYSEAHLNVFISVSNFYMKVISPSLSKNRQTLLLLLLLRKLGLYRESKCYPLITILIWNKRLHAVAKLCKISSKYFHVYSSYVFNNFFTLIIYYRDPLAVLGSLLVS